MQGNHQEVNQHLDPEIEPMFFDIDRKFLIFVCLSVVAIGIIFAALPEAWITSSNAGEIVEWVRIYWPKMNSDAQTIDNYWPARGARYVLATVFSAPFFLTCALFTIWLSRNRMSFAKPLPTYVTFGNLLVLPILLIGLGYVGIFEQSMAASDARAARNLFRSIACVFWPPLVFGTMAIGILRTFGTYSAWSQGRLN